MPTAPSETPQDDQGLPPGAWVPARRLALRALAPVERFLQIEAASGVVLIVAALVALAWANSSLSSAYVSLWHTPLALRVGSLVYERDLHFAINDGLMTLFFFVAGLEIRRELDRGELSELRRAALPLLAALGGMLLPAGVYLLFNAGRASASGWGVPMATDIAFAVGVLALLGPRVPPALRIFLLALAVIDDVGAILVIALFYAVGVQPFGFAIIAAGVGWLLTLQLFGVRSAWAYVAPACVMWAGAERAGLHPTLAGVAVGLLTPVRAWFGPTRFLRAADRRLAALRAHGSDALDERGLLPDLDALDQARREAISPVERLQHALHRWVAFAVMPLFALANAGVALGELSFEGDAGRVFLGVAVGLLVGKTFGIFGASWLGVKSGLSRLPGGVGFSQVGLVGLVGGIGFTMALFVAGLAFPPGPLQESAKLGILTGSGASAVLSYLLGRLLLPTRSNGPRARTAAEGESATDL